MLDEHGCYVCMCVCMHERMHVDACVHVRACRHQTQKKKVMQHLLVKESYASTLEAALAVMWNTYEST
jgi:hypothetical protein